MQRQGFACNKFLSSERFKATDVGSSNSRRLCLCRVGLLCAPCGMAPRTVDLRSDTLTHPTEAMRDVMFKVCPVSCQGPLSCFCTSSKQGCVRALSRHELETTCMEKTQLLTSCRYDNFSKVATRCPYPLCQPAVAASCISKGHLAAARPSN